MSVIHAASHFDNEKGVAYVWFLFYNYGALLGDPLGRLCSATKNYCYVSLWYL